MRKRRQELAKFISTVKEIVKKPWIDPILTSFSWTHDRVYMNMVHKSWYENSIILMD